VLAFVLERGGAPKLVERPEPPPRRGWTRVRVRFAGICSTDLELARGYMDFEGVLGHEFVGEALDGPLAGRRVVAEINFGCGRCERCLRGLARHCPDRRVLGILGADGALAEFVAVPDGNLHAVPDAVDDRTAVFTEPVAAACEILEQSAARGLEGPALVLGDGKLGPLVAQVLAGEGLEVHLHGRHLDRLAWIEERGVRRIESVPARRYPTVVDATGSRSGLQAALAAVVPRGTVVLKTTVADRYELNLAPVVVDEITIVGSRCGPFAPALERLADGRVRVDPLVDGCYPLEEAERAFEAARRPGTRKILVAVS